MKQHICNRTAFDRAKKGCSPARMRLNFDEVFEKDGSSIADSQQATRILKAVDGVLDEDDVDLIISMLEKSGKLTSNEAASAKEALHGETMNTAVEESQALDAAYFRRRQDTTFPHADRLARNNGRGDTSNMSLDASSARSVSITNAAAAIKERDEMFPDYNRLKA